LVILREMTEEDMEAIKKWPIYTNDFEVLDYALRDNGWIDEYRRKSGTICYAAMEGPDAIGFTILSKTKKYEAEFRIALRGDKTGQGFGRVITLMTLKKGFNELGFSRIHLIVRKNNQRAIKLYQGLGFIDKGDCMKEIHGKMVDFNIMDICKDLVMKKEI